MTYTVSMLTATDVQSHVHLIIGSNPLASSRCGQSLNTGAKPIIIAPDTANIHYALQKRIDDGQVKWLQTNFEDNHLFTLGREEVNGVVDAVFITSNPTHSSSAHISSLCKRNRIPINVVDAPQLCTFTLLSTHHDGPLQIGVTTNGRGCKLASRIRREIASSLPPELGSACLKLGDVRRRIQAEDHLIHEDGGENNDFDDSVDQSSNFNRLVTDEDLDAAKNRRMRWLSQICEYWPLRRLAAITDDDVSAILKSYTSSSSSSSPPVPIVEKRQQSSSSPNPPSSSSSTPRRGRIILAGSGPGHPDLLTRATHKAIQSADLILADKLVPSGVLDLIPRRTPVTIARKFPGNADAAQEELHSLATSAANSGKTVLRLKQGDPYLYGRGGEEVEYFRSQGFDEKRGEIVVLPGVTSALSAPLFAGIPVTQRDVADGVLICTGTGKKGKPPSPPEFVASRTVVFLMALHRIEGLVKELTCRLPQEEEEEKNAVVVGGGGGGRKLWPRSTPCAVIERASCPDQRVIRTTLDKVAEAIEQEGSRPPGLLVVGRACEFLNPPEKGRAWSTEEGFRGLELDEVMDFGSLGGGAVPVAA